MLVSREVTSSRVRDLGGGLGVEGWEDGGGSLLRAKTEGWRKE